MKIAMIIIRSLMGALFLFASLAFFLKLAPQPELPERARLFMQGMLASGYLLNFIKITELVCALSFLSGRFVTLASVVIFPITLNIFLYHLFVLPQGIPMAIALLGANLFLAFYYKENYRSLFTQK
ncbi:MAG: DoxX family protein [Ignavibacteria bacterium]|nr:DoxX family protein [Ignavibacteria bacterium]